jgi:hypothetical protein
LKHSSNDETGNYKENINADEPAGNRQAGVIRDHCDYCDGAQTLNICPAP